MKLSREQVLYVAELAKLSLSEHETELFADQLSAILDYAEVLKGIDTDAIPPTAQVVAGGNVTRPDVVGPSLSPEEVLANAPQRQENYFKVKRILD